MVKTIKRYLQVALLGAILTCFMATMLTGLVLDIVLVAIGLGLIGLYWKLR